MIMRQDILKLHEWRPTGHRVHLEKDDRIPVTSGSCLLYLCH